MTDYREARQPLLLAINLVAPTGAVQQNFVNLLHKMEEAGETDEACFKALVNALADGVNFGNWPMQKPQWKFSTRHDPFWSSQVLKHEARVLQNGENPKDFPAEAVAFETLNFGWILSAPDAKGSRLILLQY